MTFLRRIELLLERAEYWSIAVLCCSAFILGILQVVLRYVFNTGFYWNEAVFVVLTIWAMFLGGSRAIGNNLHARVELITELLPAAGVRVFNLLALLSALLLSLIYFIGGYIYVQFVNAMGISDMESGIADAITYGIVPLTMLLFIVRYLIKLTIWFRDPGEYSRTTVVDHTASGV